MEWTSNTRIDTIYLNLSTAKKGSQSPFLLAVFFMYSIKEIFLSIQGEGFFAGKPSVFIRFSKCNLWTGREQDRSKAICSFCDTDFLNNDGQLGGRYANPQDLWDAVQRTWQSRPIYQIIFTGGEPLLQVDKPLVDYFQSQGAFLCVETNGTLPLPAPVDWVCVSPKAHTEIVLTKGNELKLVYPQPVYREPEYFSMWDFDYFYLQPLEGANTAANTKRCLAYCLEHPQWSLSLQLHKILSIP